MRKIFYFILPFLCVFLASCTSNTIPQTSKYEIVKVYLEKSEDYEILSSNPVVINKGEDAEFKVEIPVGYRFDSSKDGIFKEEESTFIVENVQYSMNASFKTRIEGEYILTINNDDSKGDVIITPNRKGFDIGEEVTIKVTPKDNNEFMCYSLTNPYRRSEDEYGKATAMPISFEEEYTFNITGDMTIVTNYFDNSLIKMEYNANGGETIDGLESFEVDYRITHPNKNPQTILGTYYLFKEGYTLESYNTKKDGTGDRIGIGSKVHIKNAVDNKITLYAQWKEWTEASSFETLELEDGTLAINNYIGSKDIKEIVVPNIIDGKIVSIINENSFINLEFENLVLNTDLREIKDNAVNNCLNLKSLLMFTNIQEITDKAINSNTLEKLYINSTIYPNNLSTHEKDLTCQIDNIEAMENERVIFVGQSTLRYNHDYTPFKVNYPNKDFYVYGMQAGAQFALPLDILINYLNSNDIVIVSVLENTLRPRYIGPTTIEYLKYNFALLLNINYQDYKEILFPSYKQFLSYMSNGLDKDVFNLEKGLRWDNFGSVTWGGQGTEDINNVDPTYTPKFEQHKKVENLEYLDEIIERSPILKENRFLTWSTYNQNSITDYSIFDDWEIYVKSNINEFNYFDSIRENIYPGNYFREKDSIHLSFFGSSKRIERWIKQIPISE